MKQKALFLLGFFLVWACFLPAQDQTPRLQYGFKFGIIKNSFTALPNSPNNPFSAMELDSKIGFIAGTFYDVAIFRGSPIIYFTTGASYKFLNFKGDFATKDDPVVLGDFHNYFHVLDIPVGIKVAFDKMNGRPYLGAGVQTDFMLAENKSVNTSGATATEIDTIPGYNSRVNVGFYINTGFEIPTSSIMYCIDFKYIWWGMDNFTAEQSFYKRSKGEIQLTFGLKFD